MPENEAAGAPLPALRGASSSPDGPQNTWSAGVDGLALPTPFPPPPPGREVAFVLTAEDAASAQRIMVRSNRSWIGLAVLAMMLALASAFLSGTRRIGIDFFTKVLGPLFLPFFFAIAFYLFLLHAAKKKAGKQLEDASLQVVRLTPEYVYLLDSENESKTRWRRVAVVQDTPTHLIIRFINNTFMPVPKRAFANEAEVKGFYDEAVAFWRAGGGGEAV